MVCRLAEDGHRRMLVKVHRLQCSCSVSNKSAAAAPGSTAWQGRPGALLEPRSSHAPTAGQAGAHLALSVVVTEGLRRSCRHLLVVAAVQLSLAGRALGRLRLWLGCWLGPGLLGRLGRGSCALLGCQLGFLLLCSTSISISISTIRIRAGLSWHLSQATAAQQGLASAGIFACSAGRLCSSISRCAAAFEWHLLVPAVAEHTTAA